MKVPVLGRLLERYRSPARAAADMDAELFRALLDQAFGRTRMGAVDPDRADRGWVYGANRQMGGRIASLSPELYIAKPDPAGRVRGRRESESWKRSHWDYDPVHEHPFLSLLEAPNPEMSGAAFRWLQALMLQRHGVAYVLFFPRTLVFHKDKLEATYWSLERMYLLEPRLIKTRPGYGRERGVFTYGTRASMDFRGAPWSRSEREEWRQEPYPFVMAVDLPGGSPTAAASAPIQNLWQLEKMHYNQLANGVHAQLVFYLLQKGDDPEAWSRAVKILKAGVGKAGEPTVLPKDRVEVAKSPVSNQEMQFAELSVRERQQVLATMGASDSVVGLGGNLNRATLWGMEHMLAVGAIDPLNLLVAEALNGWVLPLYPGQSERTRLWLRFRSAKMVDDQDQARMLRTLVDGGIYSPNEARAELGKGGHPDGDRLSSKGSSSTASPEGTPTPDEAQQASANADRTSRSRSLDDIRRQVRTPEGRDQRWRSLEGRALPFERRMAREAAALFRTQGVNVAAAIETMGGVQLSVAGRDGEPVELAGSNLTERYRGVRLSDEEKKAADSLVAQVFGAEESRAAWESLLLGTGTLAGLAAMNGVMQDTGGLASVAASDPAFRAFMQTRAFEFSRLVTRTTAEALRGLIWQAFREGVATEDVVGRVTALFGDWAEGRAKTIAQTEVGGVFGWGEQRAMEEAAEVDPSIQKMWLTMRDNVVRDSHDAADGQTVGVNEFFTVGTCEMMHPLDHMHCSEGEEIIGCRCRQTVA